MLSTFGLAARWRSGCPEKNENRRGSDPRFKFLALHRRWVKIPGFEMILDRSTKLSAVHVLHAVELAMWVLAAAASLMSLIQPKHALMWLAIAGILCNVALVLAHI
jgi:hypothetical protein